ncbi:MAG: nucleotidyl transferase AbiEii/AbiGii toxin family protein [Nocardioides sp.]|uniref:nucleotidyl transferase AbiEii/AbiGii toxin family protein n=1 Tax=Nocardioides sp. TaxID=35761 RepID=UPI003265365B
MVSAFDAAVSRATNDLDEVGARWAMIGGLAVSARATPRFTKDVDFAVAVADDNASEALIHQLRDRGYTPQEIVEHEYLERLSTVRLVAEPLGVAVDLLFASSGIEEEIVAAASSVEILPGLQVSVASTGHLIALKVLARRGQDLTDLDALLASASERDFVLAREAVALIAARGFHRGQDVVADLEQVIAAAREA